MLHLARVAKNNISGKLELQLLACQKSEFQWAFCEKKYLPLNQKTSFNEGLLMLVELGADSQIISFRDANDWVLNLIRQYLASGNVNPDFIAQEQARIERWRQELTSQNQDLTRIRLEVEIRREELQQLEETLNQEKEKLEIQARDIEIRREELQQLEETLNQEKEKLEIQARDDKNY
jgi:hypothetical protein